MTTPYPIITYAAVSCCKCGVLIPQQANALWDSSGENRIHHVECPAPGAPPPGPDHRFQVGSLLRILTNAGASVRNAKLKEQEAQGNLNILLDKIGMAMFPGDWARVEERTAIYLDLGDKFSAATGGSKAYWAGRARTARERMINAQDHLRQQVLDAVMTEKPKDAP